jgi:hypothetical protein
MFIERGEKRDERNEKKDEEIKKAFDRVKTDIFNIGKEISSLKLDIIDIKNQLNKLTNNQTINPTIQQINPTHQTTPTDNPTVPQEVRGLKYPNLGISIGNRGVPTDKPTDKQTDNPTHFYTENELNYPQIQENQTPKPLSQDLTDAREILDSLDSLKKEIRLKFKAMTNQEMLVFSTIYQLEQLYPDSLDYGKIAQKLRLSPSSIRDYTQRLINKGIPILKEKLNNKKILLKISPELKKIATLNTIIRLRDL